MNAVAGPAPEAWARPGLLRAVVQERDDGLSAAALRLTVAPDARRTIALEQALMAVPGVHRVDLERTARRLRLRWDPARVSLPQLLRACAAAGSPAQPLARAALADRRRAEAHAALRRLLVAGLFAMQAMMFAFVLYLGEFQAVDATTLALFRWLCLLAAAPVLVWAAQPFYRQAAADLRRGRLGTETLVTVAVLLIATASVLVTVRGAGEVYFESVSMLVFVLLLGRWLELRARQRSGALAEAARDAAPVAAERCLAQGGTELVALAELRPGDEVRVGPGAVVPADGCVLGAGSVQVNEAVVTGETRLRACAAGDRIVAGSVVAAGTLRLHVERGAAASTLARLETLAQHAGQRLDADGGDRLAARFAARVLALAGLTALFWLWQDPGRVFAATVAVLVVACPCAFALAAPVVGSRATTVLARHGVWITRARALAALARVDVVLLDKTGTLTTPRLDVTAATCPRGGDPQALLRLAGALAAQGEHPLAQALRAATAGQDLPAAHAVEVVPGGGVRGIVAGRRLRLGSAAFIGAAAGDAAADALLLGDAAGVLAAWPVRERPRLGAAAALSVLAGAGLELEITSGDAPARVAALAGQLGVTAWQARQRPEAKLARLRALQAGGACVLAVGDGSNDAPLLAAADVSAALAGGTQLARAHADMLLAAGLGGLVHAHTVAVQAARVLAQNRRGALLYNLCAVPFAAAGLVSPWLAALGMSLSSLAVVLNALRIGREPRVGGTPPARLVEVS